MERWENQEDLLIFKAKADEFVTFQPEHLEFLPHPMCAGDIFQVPGCPCRIPKGSEFFVWYDMSFPSLGLLPWIFSCHALAKLHNCNGICNMLKPKICDFNGMRLILGLEQYLNFWLPCYLLAFASFAATSSVCYWTANRARKFTVFRVGVGWDRLLMFLSTTFLVLRSSYYILDATPLTSSNSFQLLLDAMLWSCSNNFQLRSWCYELPTTCCMLRN